MTEDARPVVLVATDDADLGDRYADALAGSYAVRRADSVAGALAAVDGSVSVALVECAMVAPAQAEVIAALREGAGEVRIAAVTGDDPDFDVIETGFDGHLPRGAGGETVRGTVDDLLAGHDFADRIEEYRSLVEDRAAIEATDDDLDEEIGAVDGDRERLADDAEFVATLRELTGDAESPVGDGDE